MFWGRQPIKCGVVGIGEARTARQITEPFTVGRGWRSFSMSVSEAEQLRDWLAEQLESPSLRRPRVVSIGPPHPAGVAVECEPGKTYETTWDERGEIVSHREVAAGLTDQDS